MPLEHIADLLTLKEIEAETFADRRSIKKELRVPDSVTGIVGARIRRAIARRGLRSAQVAAEHDGAKQSA